MIEHFALQFCEAYGKLCRHIDAVLIRETNDRPKQLKERELSDGYKHFVAQEAIAPIMAEIERLGFESELILRVKRLFGRLSTSAARSWTAELLLDSLIDIRRGIGLELQKHKFAYLCSPYQQYFEQERLFGDEVYEKFKSARQEIKDAGNCLAVSLPTASVFHSMRAAEYGLRALAHDRRIRLPKSKPVELATWDEIIKKLEQAEQEIQGYPKTLAREAQFEFYHGAMMEFKRFKNTFRNSVMHCRKTFDEHDAQSTFNHVKAFMNILSERIGEGGRTPKIWKGPKWLKAS